MQGTITWIFFGLILLLVALLALSGLLYWFRTTPLRTIRDLDGGADVPPVDRPDFLEAVQRHLGTVVSGGHRVDLLFNGEQIYPCMFEDLAAAESLITWHVFWFQPGELAERLRSVLAERARAGVRVLFLHDWFGSRKIRGEYFDDLRTAGVEVVPFRKPRLGQIYKINQRSHVRTVVIDGEIGYTGGFAIADEWTGDGRSRGSWRDTSVRFEGPAVHQLQVAFAADWVEATGELLVGPRVFPSRNGDRPDGTVAGIFHSAPSLGGTRAERFFALSLVAARERCWITSGYFVPDADFRDLLCRKAREGVDVRVLHPGANTDRIATWYAARRYYEELVGAGVRIWEYRPTMVHAKTFVVDRTWCAVGTTNFDNRSMALNDEVALLVHDEAAARTLGARFLEDLEHAEEVDLDAFRRRGFGARAAERLAGLVSPIL